MESGKEITPVLSPKPTLSTQACHGAGATQSSFSTSAVASPPPHPNLWGNQGAAFSIIKTEEILADGKDSLSVKIPNGIPGNMGLFGGKSGQIGKEALGSGCDATSQRAESGSEGSSDASDVDTNQLASSEIRKKSFSQMLADVSAPGNPTVPVTTTNLNNEMDLWNALSAGAAPRPSPSSVLSQVPLVRMVGHGGVLHDHQPTKTQDERELKRLRRKQSNRESARRSKLRKQAECEELQAKVEKISDENHTLADELNRLAKQCEMLTSENNNIMEELTQASRSRCGVISNLQVNNLAANGEDNSCGHYTSTESYSKFASLQAAFFFQSNGKFAS